MTIEIHELDITDGLNKMLYDKLKAENEELLKKIDELEEELDTHSEAELQMIKQCFQLQKKLDIAIKALEWYSDYTNSTKGVFNMKPEKEAQDALKQIKEEE